MKMNNLTEQEKNIIEGLRTSLVLDNPPDITQERFDLIIDELIKNDKRELMWRLCGTFNGYNYNKVIDYFIKVRDSYYIEELVSFTCGDLDQEYLVNKMIETNDKIFIRDSLEECGDSMQYSIDDEYLEKLLDFIKN